MKKKHIFLPLTKQQSHSLQRKILRILKTNIKTIVTNCSLYEMSWVPNATHILQVSLTQMSILTPILFDFYHQTECHTCVSEVTHLSKIIKSQKQFCKYFLYSYEIVPNTGSLIDTWFKRIVVLFFRQTICFIFENKYFIDLFYTYTQTGRVNRGDSDHGLSWSTLALLKIIEPRSVIFIETTK